MFYCSSLCSSAHSESELLIQHYKHSHFYTKSSVFRCANNSCTRVFSDSYSFQKHLKTAHETEKEQKENMSTVHTVPKQYNFT